MQDQNNDELRKAMIENGDTVQMHYPDTLEGELQYLVDRSLYYAGQEKIATSNVKRDLYRRKREKNNRKMYNLLVRTPNAFNPLMKYLQPSAETTEAAEPVDVVEAAVAADLAGKQ